MSLGSTNRIRVAYIEPFVGGGVREAPVDVVSRWGVGAYAVAVGGLTALGLLAVGATACATIGLDLTRMDPSPASTHPHISSTHPHVSSMHRLNMSEVTQYVEDRGLVLTFDSLGYLRGRFEGEDIPSVFTGSFTHFDPESHLDIATVSIVPDELSTWSNVHWGVAFTHYVLSYGKGEEYSRITAVDIQRRFSKYIQNASAVYEHNLHSKEYAGSLKDVWYLYSLGLNSFADLDHEDNSMLGLKSGFTKRSDDFVHISSIGDYLPESLDWRDEGCVQEVKNQGQCGSCWAFSTVESIESNICVARTKVYGRGRLSVPVMMNAAGPVSPNNKPNATGMSYKRSEYLPNLSEQQLVDCGGDTGNGGCNGGAMQSGFQYVINNKELCTEEEYPYTAKDGSCSVSGCNENVDWRVTSWNGVTKYSAKELKSAIFENGAVSISIQADKPIFMFYRGGILHDGKVTPGSLRSGRNVNGKYMADDNDTCGTNLDHGVTVVGWGRDTDSGENYWIVKNSWGDSWGEKGYVRMSADAGGEEGECGILMDASYPQVSIKR